MAWLSPGMDVRVHPDHANMPLIDGANRIPGNATFFRVVRVDTDGTVKCQVLEPNVCIVTGDDPWLVQAHLQPLNEGDEEILQTLPCWRELERIRRLREGGDAAPAAAVRKVELSGKEEDWRSIKVGDFVRYACDGAGKRGVGQITNVDGSISSVTEMGVPSSTCSLPTKYMKVITKDEVRQAILASCGLGRLPDMYKTEAELTGPHPCTPCASCGHQYCFSHHGLHDSSRSDFDFYCANRDCLCARCRDADSRGSLGCCQCSDGYLQEHCELGTCRVHGN